jgi:hypothetical protein
MAEHYVQLRSPEKWKEAEAQVNKVAAKFSEKPGKKIKCPTLIIFNL